MDFLYTFFYLNRLTNRKERAMKYEKLIIETSKSIYRYLLKIERTSHAHQAKILRHPHNENFTFFTVIYENSARFSVLGDLFYFKFGMNKLYIWLLFLSGFLVSFL